MAATTRSATCFLKSAFHTRSSRRAILGTTRAQQYAVAFWSKTIITSKNQIEAGVTATFRTNVVVQENDCENHRIVWHQTFDHVQLPE
jgi:hypothetical protein